MYSRSTTHHNFMISKIPISLKFPVSDGLFRKWVFIWKILIRLENVNRVYCRASQAQLRTTFYFSKFPFLQNSGSVMYYVFRKWVFILKILIWLENIIRIYLLLAKRNSVLLFFFQNSGSVMDYVSKMSFLSGNINVIGKCKKILLLYPPSTTQHNFQFFKIPISPKLGSVIDYVFRKWVFIWKILMWLANNIRIYCSTSLAQLTTTFCFSKFLFLWNPGSVMDYVSKMSFHLENINLIGKCYEGLWLYSRSTTYHNFLISKIPISSKFRVGDGLCFKNEFSFGNY